MLVSHPDPENDCSMSPQMKRLRLVLGQFLKVGITSAIFPILVETDCIPQYPHGITYPMLGRCGFPLLTKCSLLVALPIRPNSASLGGKEGYSPSFMASPFLRFTARGSLGRHISSSWYGARAWSHADRLYHDSIPPGQGYETHLTQGATFYLSIQYAG